LFGAFREISNRLRLCDRTGGHRARHPAMTAITTFDELRGGRTKLGLGVGGQGFREFDIERRLPVAASREASTFPSTSPPTGRNDDQTSLYIAKIGNLPQ